jgi:DUF4097 and DUF4098 domain-containing protein YvlB
MKKISLIAILALAAIGLATSGLKSAHSYAALATQTSLIDQKPKGDELTEEFHQTYQLSPMGRVSIANINGDVHINVWDQNSVKVDAVKRAYSQPRLSEMTIDVTNTADTVRIKTKYPERQNYDGRNREDSAGSVEYTLTIPRRANLDGAELVNGSVDIEGLQGDVQASLVNGTVTAAGLSGDVKLSTVNGRVEANLVGLESSKSVSLNSVNGSIVLTIPGNASADVKANTVHGPITNDFGWTVEDGQYVGHNMSGQIGSGGARVRLNNVNGSITVKRGAV